MALNERDMREYLAAWNAHDAGRVASYFTEDASYEDVALGMISRGKQQIREFADSNFRAFTDVKYELVSLVIAGDRAACEWVMSGTHDGGSPRLPATGKPFSIRGASAIEFAGDKIRRNSDYWNFASLLQQVGLMPAV